MNHFMKPCVFGFIEALRVWFEVWGAFVEIRIFYMYFFMNVS